MANSQLNASFILGFPGDSLGSSGLRTLNAAGTWAAISFIARGKTLDTVSLYVTKVGSPAAGDITCELQADSGSGTPSNTALETKSPSSIGSGAARLNISGFTTALTDGNLYWLVIKNNNGTPASNYITFAYGSSGMLPVGRYSSLSLTHGWSTVGTTNSGAAWATTAAYRSAMVLIKYSDNTYDGVPLRSTLRSDTTISSTYRFYGTRAIGMKFSGLTSGITYNLRTVSVNVVKVGSPAALRCRVYSGSTLVATSRSVPAAQTITASSGSITTFEFGSAVSLTSASAPYRVVLDQVGAGGDASNYYVSGYFLALDTSSEVLALGPMSGTWAHTYTTDNTAGTITWVDTTDLWPLCTMSLDADTPFTVAGAGIKRGVSMVGGYNG